MSYTPISASSTLRSPSDSSRNQSAMQDKGDNSIMMEDDRPVQVDAFLNNVRWCKAVLTLSLVGNLIVEALLVSEGIKGSEEGITVDLARTFGTMMKAERVVDIVGLVVTSLLSAFLILSLIYRPRRSADAVLNLPLHSAFCLVMFLATLSLVIAHSIPSIAYTVATHRGAPLVHSYTLSTLRTAALVIAFLASGVMRRGPKLHYEPLRLGTGFGVNAAPDDVLGGDMIKGKIKPGDSEVLLRRSDAPVDQETRANVLDYHGCSMLSFVFLAYMAKLAQRSTVVPQLLPSDLPHMEAWVRRSGAEQNMTLSAGDDNDEGAIRLPEGGTQITRWSLVRNLWRGRGLTVFITLVTESLWTCFSYLQVWSMHEIISTFDNPDSDMAYARLMCWGLFVGQSAECIVQAYSWSRENYLLHMPVKMAISSLLFKKILRTTDVTTIEAHNLSETETQAGKGRSQIINLLTIDASVMASLATRIWNASNAFIALVFGVVFLYQMFGISAVIGIACVPLSTPLSFYVSRQSYRADRAWARARDARVSAIKEFLLCYKVIKLNAFEPSFRTKIDALRAHEVLWQRWRFTLGTLFNILADQLPSLAIFVTFFFHTKVFHHKLEPSTAFVAIAVFDRVKGALQFVPKCIQDVSGALVALNRLVDFLNRDEVDIEEWKRGQGGAPGLATGGIVFDGVTVGWPKGEEDVAGAFELKNVDLAIPRGKMTLVCGPLGSGKTLLLRALLGEATVLSGSLVAPRTVPDATPLDGYSIKDDWTKESWLTGSVSYAPQQAYIRHGTIRDNILFGQPMWRARYKEVLRQCSLLGDLELLADGDMTEVGDQGVNLSGGQKARVNLARCLYSRSSTVYLDDILSAVDAHTAQYIIQECLAGDLVRDRTVVLVSHHVALCLPVAEYMICLRDGRVEKACLTTTMDRSDIDKLEALESPTLSMRELERRISMVDQRPATIPQRGSKVMKTDQDEDEVRRTSRQIYKAEHSSIGRVASSHYMLVFVSAGGAVYWLILFVIFGGTNAFDVLKTLFLRQWSSDADPRHVNHNLGLYFTLVSSGVLLGGFRWIWLYGVGFRGFYNRGSKVIHSRLLDVVLGAKLSFFEETPKGRILNIFGSDMARLDGKSADDFGRSLMATLFVGTSAIMVCFQAPILLGFLLVLGVPTYWLSGVLGKLRADLRRLSSVASSPLITLYNDAIEGIVMLRAFGSSRLMDASMQVLINREREAFTSDFLVYNWVRSLVRTLASVFVTATGFAVLGTDLSGAQVGVVLAFAVGVSQGLFGLLEMYSGLEQTFVSAERINHYIQMDTLEPTAGLTPPPSWPSSGTVSFRDLSVRYAPDLPEVLHKVSFDVEPGMRVGLVGATGSGKSTLALSLFRAIEPHEGKIEIDGLDISTVKLNELRERLNMVVQDGSLCSGTLREALDITGLKDDAQIYQALRQVHLIPAHKPTDQDLLDNPFTNLDTFVAVEGSNFSHGQRQLLCLARALLKGCRILVMDEATSSVDFEMDAKITQTIKECFEGTTMVVIAHRLATIMHYDRVLVLDKGKVQEFGSPADLIADSTSAFHGLCMAAGEEEFDRLAGMVR